MKNRKLLISLISIIFVMTIFINVSATEIAYVNCNNLNVRVSPNTTSDIVNTIGNGTAFDIIYADNGWYNIRMNDGTTGFVYSKYVSKESVAALSNESVDSTAGLNVVNTAKQYVGSAYVYGASGPNAFDCSGFTSYVYKQYGIGLPRTSTSQGNIGEYVVKENLKAGDLVLFSNRGDRRINHVGIYIGDNQFVHASTSNRGVVIDNLTSSYYIRNYVTARRVL